MAALFDISGDLRFEVVEKIADGRMGAVFRAYQIGSEGFAKEVAIKVMHERFAMQRQFIENFIGEGKLVADLIHPQIVQIYNFGDEGKSLYRRMGAHSEVKLQGDQRAYYMVMEYIRGVNLAEFIREVNAQGRELPGPLAVFIASRIARGLAYAHGKKDAEGEPLGIVHRDVSPRSVMMSFEGDVKLTDFGVAKAAGLIEQNEGEQLSGTPEYMSPEQANFEVTDQRSDIFSNGIILAELLLGQNMFAGADAAESRQRITDLPIPQFRNESDYIDLRLDAILQKALAHDLEVRYSSAERLMKDLEYHMYHKGYGPTNETLAKFMKELLPERAPS
ncbi:MAG: serine/threonine protein kinase [Actinobacteria bacterium]|nr:serine/threonine protein kinase [Actinomycetota bacterium]